MRDKEPKITVSMPQWLLDKLKDEANKREMATSALVRLAVKQMFESEQ